MTALRRPRNRADAFRIRSNQRQLPGSPSERLTLYEAEGSRGPWSLISRVSFLLQNQWVGSLPFKRLHFYYKWDVLLAAAERREDEE